MFDSQDKDKRNEGEHQKHQPISSFTVLNILALSECTVSIFNLCANSDTAAWSCPRATVCSTLDSSLKQLKPEVHSHNGII